MEMEGVIDMVCGAQINQGGGVETRVWSGIKAT